MVYTKKDAAGNLASSMTKSGSDCSCTNYLAEIEYIVQLAVKDVPQSASTANSLLRKYY